MGLGVDVLALLVYLSLTLLALVMLDWDLLAFCVVFLVLAGDFELLETFFITYFTPVATTFSYFISLNMKFNLKLLNAYLANYNSLIPNYNYEIEII